MAETPHTLTVHGTNNSSSWYTFKLASGDRIVLGPGTEDPDRIEQNGRRASGKVKNSSDTYRFGGVIVDAAFDGDIDGMEVEINGKTYDPRSVVREWQKDAGVFSEYAGSGESSGTGSGAQVIGIGDDGGIAANDYRLVTSKGELKNSTAYGASESDGDIDKNRIGQPRVNDAVWGGKDAWKFDGNVVNLFLDDPDDATINMGNGWKPAKSFSFVHSFGNNDGGGGDTNNGSSGGSGDGSSEPSHRDTGGSDGVNRSDGSGGGAPGAYVISPGDLQSAMDDLREDAGDAPGNERRSGAMLEPNATFDPGETVHIPRNFVLDASKASIVPSASYDLFTLDLGALVERPYINLRGVGNGESYDARVFTLDPANVTYGAPINQRNSGYVSKDAWKPRSGSPHNKYRFIEHERQNFFANGSGVAGGHTLGNPRDNSTLFYLHQDQNDSGWNNSCLALFTLAHSAREVAYPIDMHSEGTHGFINDVRFKGFYSGWKIGITERGEHTIRKNRFMLDMQPQDGLSEHMILQDNPTAQRNVFEGCAWDAQKASGDMVRAERGTGQNVVEDYTGHGNGLVGGPASDTIEVTNPDGY